VAGGTIVEAVDNQPWSGEANVHVPIANWVKHPAQQSSGSFPLAGRAGEGGSGGEAWPRGKGKRGASPFPNPPPQGEGRGPEGEQKGPSTSGRC
jgi:hypothetical protein